MLNAGLDHYDMKRKRMPLAEGDFYWDTVKVVPEEVEVIHCVTARRWMQGKSDPQFLTSWTYETAWCGSVIKVVLPNEFESDDAEACPECVAALKEDGQRQRQPRRVPPTRSTAVTRWESHPDRDPYDGLVEYEQQWIDQRRRQVADENRERHKRIKEARERRQRGA